MNDTVVFHDRNSSLLLGFLLATEQLVQLMKEFSSTTCDLVTTAILEIPQLGKGELVHLVLDKVK